MTNIERREISIDEKLSHNTTLSYKNIFYKNIEAEICEILRIW